MTKFIIVVGLVFLLSTSVVHSKAPDQDILRPNNHENVVMFVHGYTGDAMGTWKHFRELLRDDPDLGGYDFLFLDYPSRFVGPNPDIEFVGRFLGTEYRERLSSYKHVYLVGHSMGGLVIKSMVIDYLRDGRSSDLKKIEHILFLATPNRGVDIPLLMRLFNPQLGDLFVTSKQ